jgi:parallel beta-helix repeat protein
MFLNVISNQLKILRKLNSMRFLFKTVFVFLILSSLSFSQDISACTTLNAANTVYDLTASPAAATATCMTVGANNVTLDCHGYTITYKSGVAGTGYGVNITNYNNSIIRNCVIVSGSVDDYGGVYTYAAENIIVANSTINTTGDYNDAISLNSASKNVTIINCSLSTLGSAAAGVWITGGSNRNTITNSTLRTASDSRGVTIDSAGHNNTISGNSIFTSHTSGIGVYIVGNSRDNAVDGNFINTSEDFSDGVWVIDGFNETIRNNIVHTYKNQSQGISLKNTSNTSVYNNTVVVRNETSIGIFIYNNSDNNTVANSSFINTAGFALVFNNASTHKPGGNIIYNNLFNGSSTPVGFGAGSSIDPNTFNISNQTGTRIYGLGTNIGGNYYTNSTGSFFSDTCDDTDKDGFCDLDYNLSTNTPCLEDTCGTMADFLPLSDEAGTDVYGNLSVTLLWPDAGVNNNVAQNQTFQINATVDCVSDDPSAICGIVNGTARYNYSSTSPDAAVNKTNGETPFYTLSGNPQTCGSMSRGDECNLSWTINASGNVGTNWKLDVLFTSDQAVNSNNTDDANVSIVGCLVDVTLDFNAVIFSNETYQPYPNSYGNPAINNSLSFYNITVNAGSCVLDIYTSASDLISQSTPAVLGVDNMTFNSVSEDYGSSTRYSIIYQTMKTGVTPVAEFTSWFWIDLPPIYAGAYNGTISIASVEEGESP